MLSPSSPVVHVPGVNDMQAPSPAGQSMSQISRQLSQSQAAWAGSRPPFPGQVRALRMAQSPGASGQSACMCLLWVLALRLAQCSETDPAGRPGAQAGAGLGGHGARPCHRKPGDSDRGSPGGDFSRTCPKHPGPKPRNSCACTGWPGPRPVPSQPGGPWGVLPAQSSMSPCHHTCG